MSNNPYEATKKRMFDGSDPPKHYTYYLKGNAVEVQHEQATNIQQDYAWLSQSPEHQVTGQHYNGTRWVWDRDAFVKTYDDIYTHQVYPSDTDAMSLLFRHLKAVDDDHPISKLIAMHKLVGAL